MSLETLLTGDGPAAVRAALHAVSGSAAVDEVAAVHGGLSGARLVRVEAGGRSYAVRFDPRPPQPGNPPERWLACLRAAADAGIAPPLLHASPDGRVTVAPFLVKRPWPEGPERATMPGRMVELTRALHALPGLPPFVHVVDFIEDILARVRGVPLPGPAQRLAAGLPPLLALARRHPDEASCHNDLNPGNFLWDGERLWLVDWEAAGRGDPFHDLATLALFLRRAGDLSLPLLEAWRRRPPTERDQAKLAVMRVVSAGFFGLHPMLVALGAGFRPGAADLAAPPALEDWLASAPDHVAEGSRGALGRVFQLGHVLAAEGARQLEAPGLAEAVARLDRR